MDVQIVFFKEIRLDTEINRPATDIGQGRARRFLHDIAEATGQGQILAARHLGHFDKQDISSRLGPGQTGDHTDPIFFTGDINKISARAEQLFDICSLDFTAWFRTLSNLLGDLAANR